MKLVRHTGVAERWGTLSLLEQMAHIGSEAERAMTSHKNGKEARFENALERALELFDLTAADERWRGHRRREILRAREEFCRLFYADDPPAESEHGLRQYFLRFAVAARR